ncbi:hypothetical protein DP180_05460 [Enterobacter kobei]|uniref:Uncharacterized protein n=1 Tax=Enterobacter kobei TaxID=208224 RepID=A0ABX9F4V7_9ENTR|nr:hypothetical protein F0324_13315 [Enterobacter kobei]OXV29687.1 hypothetical protein CDL31_19410 [Enterobacter kobei]PWR27929.1 hypothetical protein DK504_12955 [Enterobacter kobei]RAY23923.1 hypothetical protein DP180_05460 [Enterobacter kobei]RAY24238.1 hypothetical protein DP184_18390 [Enterobacter kobei]
MVRQGFYRGWGEICTEELRLARLFGPNRFFWLLLLQINRVDSGQNVRVVEPDYYWLLERGSMFLLVYRVLERS